MQKSKPVVTNLIKQNCFVRDVVLPVTHCKKYQTQFVSCDEINDSDGVKVVESVHDYPITPEYVNSFAASSDYRSDVVGVIQNSPKRQNLGDLSNISELLSSGADLRPLYEQLAARFSKVGDDKKVVVNDTLSDKGGDNNG